MRSFHVATVQVYTFRSLQTHKWTYTNGVHMAPYPAAQLVHTHSHIRNAMILMLLFAGGRGMFAKHLPPDLGSW